MPFKKPAYLVIMFLIIFSGIIFAAKCNSSSEPEGAVLLKERIFFYNPPRYYFVKPSFLAYKISDSKLPDYIYAQLGAEDQTKYSKEWMDKAVGSIVALQIGKNEAPDFYIVGKDTFDKYYQTFDYNELKTINPDLWDRLNKCEWFDIIISCCENNLVGARKNGGPFEMVKFSDIGFDVSQDAVILAPWGETQTKPAGKDAFVVIEKIDQPQDPSEEYQYYMVNVDERGIPIGYEYADGNRSFFGDSAIITK
ncbi:MAG: hypothetical protein GY750_13575 [Lentisphaerae bacterium]|nr:hypothetical protein [Lentisphaerota bacterium]MCP4102433.1 hypothetical protein [Lentisphaerota bacterium]